MLIRDNDRDLSNRKGAFKASVDLEGQTQTIASRENEMRSAEIKHEG